MSITRAWKVYGSCGHRIATSFEKSFTHDLSSYRDGVRILTVLNSDVTGTNDFSIVIVTAATKQECREEMRGQITDGYFENVRTGRQEEIPWEPF